MPSNYFVSLMRSLGSIMPWRRNFIQAVILYRKYQTLRWPRLDHGDNLEKLLFRSVYCTYYFFGGGNAFILQTNSRTNLRSRSLCVR